MMAGRFLLLVLLGPFLGVDGSRLPIKSSMAQVAASQDFLQAANADAWVSLSVSQRAKMFQIHGSHKSWEELSNVSPDSGISVSLCVPLVPEDLEAFKATFVPSIVAQTLTPKEVIVAFSSASAEESQQLEKELQSQIPNTTVTVSAKEGKANAGENRNRAADLATGDLVVFFDADDAMHPRRLEVLAYIWKKYQPKVMLHGWSKGVERIETLENKFEIIRGEEIVTNGLQMLGPLAHAVHQGQPAVDRKVFSTVHERPDLARAQDVRFLHDVMDKFGKHDDTILYVGLPLSRFGNWRTGR